MPVVTSYKQGTPCFVDLATKDEAGAVAFYGALFGWTDESMPMGPDQYYHMFSLRGSTVAGMYKLGAEMGDHPPYWATYIAVNNADEAGRRAADAGGKLQGEAVDVFDAGRMQLLQDPQGAFVALWQAKDHIGSQIANEPGSLAWHELVTTDSGAAADFYSKTLEVETARMPMPGMEYTLIKVAGREVAGIMDILPDMGRCPRIGASTLPWTTRMLWPRKRNHWAARSWYRHRIFRTSVDSRSFRTRRARSSTSSR